MGQPAWSQPTVIAAWRRTSYTMGSPRYRIRLTLREDSYIRQTTAIAVLTILCSCLTFSVNLHAQGDSDVAQQIKQLQQHECK